MTALRRKKIVFEQLEGEKKVYIKSVADKIERYNFWLRFANEHFNPCAECQDDIQESIFEAEILRFGKTEKSLVTLKRDTNGIWVFALNFAENYLEKVGFIPKRYIPCVDCQKNLAKLIENSDNLILGNKDYEPQIELNRKFIIDDDSWEPVEKRPSTKEEQKRLKDSWFD